jgi:hypothetical protein
MARDRSNLSILERRKIGCNASPEKLLVLLSWENGSVLSHPHRCPVLSLGAHRPREGLKFLRAVMFSQLS